MKRKDAFTKAQWKQDIYRVCKECTAQKREAGTPYRCTQCGLWHAAAHFASKHHNPRWRLYRVCMSCDAVKQCFSCTKKLTKEYFTVPAWKASKPERRLCLHCQKQGKWTCARCHQKLPTLQFSHYNKMRPGGGQNGRQTCNACRAIVVQANVRKRAAKSSIYNVCNLCVRRCAVDKFSARHGKQSQTTEKNTNAARGRAKKKPQMKLLLRKK